MYCHDDSVVFTTLALKGIKPETEERYHLTVRTFIESVLKFTKNRALIVTDEPEAYGTEYGPRIKFVKFDSSLTPLTNKGATGQFQYSLKAIPIRETLKIWGPAIVVWMDCDAYLWGWNHDFYKTFIDEEDTVWGRMRANISHPNTDPIILNKVTKMGFNPAEIHSPVPIESVLIFRAGRKTMDMLNTWERLALQSQNLGLNSDYEAVEFAIACHQTEYNCKVITGSFPHTDNFRVLHDTKIFTPFV